MAHSNPALLDGLLSRLADAMAEYMCYQIEAGAQVGGRPHVWVSLPVRAHLLSLFPDAPHGKHEATAT